MTFSKKTIGAVGWRPVGVKVVAEAAAAAINVAFDLLFGLG